LNYIDVPVFDTFLTMPKLKKVEVSEKAKSSSKPGKVKSPVKFDAADDNVSSTGSENSSLSETGRADPSPQTMQN
jgi:hypothetical protein